MVMEAVGERNIVVGDKCVCIYIYCIYTHKQKDITAYNFDLIQMGLQSVSGDFIHYVSFTGMFMSSIKYLVILENYCDATQ